MTTDDKHESLPRVRLKPRSRDSDTSHEKKEGRSSPRVRPKPKSSDNDVGYGRPPREHRFKPGQSGNPKGRPKGAKNESSILREVLERKITIRSDGRVRRIPVLEGIHLRMVENALKGDVKSAAFELNRYAALVSGELQPQDLSADDREVLEAFAQRLKSRPYDDGGAP